MLFRSFYISSKKSLIESKNRISGSIRTVEMCEETFLEIDEPNDWTIIEGLLRKREQDASAKKKSRIRMFLTDCDGCLTDGGMYYSEKGDELKKFNTRDGMAFSMLREKGILTGIITGEDVELVRRRAEKLMLDIYEPGCKDKEDVIKTLCQKYNIDLSQVVYIGDDINDLESLKMVGYGWVPADAIKRVQENARYIAKSKGGEGVIREVAEWVLSKIETDE